MRMNYPNVANESNEDLLEIGAEFKKYLEAKFVDQMEKLPDIWSIDPKDIIPNLGHPFRTNGYHPALIIHFGEFCGKMAKEATENE